MQGRIYRVKLRGEYDELPHPHVVVIEFSGARDCLVVPGFDAEGTKVNAAIESLKKAGYDPSEIYVELDNAVHVSFMPPYSGKRAKWLVVKHSRLSVQFLNGCECMGTMDREALTAITDGLLALAKSRPERFSPALAKKLRQLKAASRRSS